MQYGASDPEPSVWDSHPPLNSQARQYSGNLFLEGPFADSHIFTSNQDTSEYPVNS